ncbi:hypothetical protein [Haemophilus paracuniculus]|nr:hypothetical protein [Haemophilus paracuniculus]
MSRKCYLKVRKRRLTCNKFRRILRIHQRKRKIAERHRIGFQLFQG